MHVCILYIYIYNALKSYKAMEHLRFWTLQFTPDRLFFFPYQSLGKEERCKSNRFQHFIGFGDPQRCVKSTPEPEIQPQTTFRNTWITSTLLWHLKTKARGRGNPFGKVSFLASSCSRMGQSSMPQQGLCEEGGTAAVGLECPVHNSQKLGIFCWPKRGGRKA